MQKNGRVLLLSKPFTMNSVRILFSILLCFFIQMGSINLFAQRNIQDCNSDITLCTSFFSSSSSSTIALAGGIVLTVALDSNQEHNLSRFLQNNKIALQAEIIFGGGEHLHDLARAFYVPDDAHQSFGRLTRKHRKTILSQIQNASKNKKNLRQFIQWMRILLIQENLLSEQKQI